MDSKDQWMRNFNKRVPPALDRYLREAVEQTTSHVSRRQQEALIELVKQIIQPVVEEGDDVRAMQLAGRDDAEMAQILEPYLNQLLLYSPLFMRAFIGYEALSRFAYTAYEMKPVTYLGARVFEAYAPDSYPVIDGLMKKLDRIQFSYIPELYGYTNQDGSDVLRRQRYDTRGALSRLAMSSHEGWTNKRQDVAAWAKN